MNHDFMLFDFHYVQKREGKERRGMLLLPSFYFHYFLIKKGESVFNLDDT